MEQSNFFNLLESQPEKPRIRVVVQFCGEQFGFDQWMAYIAGGWWMAYGITKDKAIDKVSKKYHRDGWRYGYMTDDQINSINNGL